MAAEVRARLLLPPAQAFRRRCGGAFAGAVAAVSFFLPDTGSSMLVCLRSEAALRLGVSGVVSCARLRLSAAIRSTTGGGDTMRFGLTGKPLIFAAINSRSAS